VTSCWRVMTNLPIPALQEKLASGPILAVA
jgi:hypothetical protein